MQNTTEPLLQLNDVDYHLPNNLIATHPSEKRTQARLLVAKRDTPGISSHQRFDDLISYFKSGDVLVLNNTKVLPARLWGTRASGGRVETVLVERVTDQEWEALLRPGGRIKKGDRLVYERDDAKLEALVLDDARENTGQRRIQFSASEFDQLLLRIGHMPLPPYIERADEATDETDYQTVFAKKPGAIAAPTAGLHFDNDLLDQLKQKGVKIVFITLHVSYGTFQPIQVDDVRNHRMYEERYEIDQASVDVLNAALSEKRRIFACGTTSVRTLESAVGSDGLLRAGQAKTDLFIYPPYEFKVCSAIITNFHLPKSSLLLLVAAFWGGKGILDLYKEAIAKEYRFYSYGDAMLLM